MAYTDQYVPKEGSQEYKEQMNHWDEDRRPQQYAAIAITTFVATVAVISRLYAQRTYRRGWGVDDAFILVALLILYAEFIASVLVLNNGAGLHQVRVLSEDTNSPHGLQNIYHNYWIVALLWAPGVTYIKLSILFLYRRLLFVQQRWFHVALWVNVLYALALGIASLLLTVLQCSPVDYYWTRYVAYYGYASPSGKCLLNMREYLGLLQILSTASDVVILLLPVPIIWNLIMPRSQKFAISGVFFLGALAIACGAVRIGMIFTTNNTEDGTWVNINTVTFTVVEAAMGIICASLPSSAPLFSHILKKLGLRNEDPERLDGGLISDPPIIPSQEVGSFVRIPSPNPRLVVKQNSFHELFTPEKRALALVWSPNGEGNRESYVSQVEQPENGILVRNKIEFSSNRRTGSGKSIELSVRTTKQALKV
ncbi:uncharacterized protein N7483_005004 [Penicillium malachiteum]|uniref:uncharacterized protein n=1 Tax=Penicillium malachiteum TaxID=1324776 RepID=UPI002548B86B|nr:uncharacterized protein N7483_005004 [Penicillium malachiteum]KAJ5730496.1 hypothetical protein N7483_005004 [Penicillium malachiteum]